MGTPGVLGDVAAQAAGFLTGGVRRVPEPQFAGSGVQVQIYHSRLDGSGQIILVHFQDVVHSGENNLDAAGGSYRSAAESGA